MKTAILEKMRAPSGNVFHEGLIGETRDSRLLEGATVADMTALVVVDVHLEHLLSARLLADVGLRGIDSVEVALHPVVAVEGVHANDAELALRRFAREILVDARVATLTSRSRIVRHTSLLSMCCSLPTRNDFWGSQHHSMVEQIRQEAMFGRFLEKIRMKKFLLPLQNMVRVDLFSGSLAVWNFRGGAAHSCPATHSPRSARRVCAVQAISKIHRQTEFCKRELAASLRSAVILYWIFGEKDSFLAVFVGQSSKLFRAESK